MYNRYIPQPDGSYRRSPRQEPVPKPPSQPKVSAEHRQTTPEPQPQACGGDHSRGFTGPPHQAHNQHRRHCQSPPPPTVETDSCRECPTSSVGGFLKNLLPRDFDTGDLLIVLLLLLMAGDCQEEQNTALLTLVLYLFL